MVAASPDALRFAVADGATESWESGPWAARLVCSYVERSPSPINFPDWLAAVRNWAPQHHPQAGALVRGRETGAGIILLSSGLELRRSQRTTGWAWRASAVGDSCLFHIRGAEPQRLSFPIASAREFGNRPALVPSSTAWQCPKPGWCVGYLLGPMISSCSRTDAAAGPTARPRGVCRGSATAARARLSRDTRLTSAGRLVPNRSGCGQRRCIGARVFLAPTAGTELRSVIESNLSCPGGNRPAATI